MSTYGTTVTATYVGRQRDAYDWDHFAWSVTLTRGDKTRTMPYRMGVGHVATKCGKPYPSHRAAALPCQHSRCSNAGPQPVAPTLYDVLTGLKSDATHGESFGDWCDSLGYDTDSRRALATYLACQASEDESIRFFGDDWSRIVNDDDYA